MGKIKGYFNKRNKVATRLAALSLIFILLFSSMYSLHAGAEDASGSEQTTAQDTAGTVAAGQPQDTAAVPVDSEEETASAEAETPAVINQVMFYTPDGDTAVSAHLYTPGQTFEAFLQQSAPSAEALSLPADTVVTGWTHKDGRELVLTEAMPGDLIELRAIYGAAPQDADATAAASEAPMRAAAGTRAGTHTVTFDSTGGTPCDPITLPDANLSGGKSYTIDGTKYFPLPAPTRIGYTFKYWGVSPTNDSRAPGLLRTDMTLYAVWGPAPVSYTVVYWRERHNLPNDFDKNNPSYYDHVYTDKSRTALTETKVKPGSESGYPFPAGIEAGEYGYREKYDKGETVIIAADGSSVVNVYFIYSECRLDFDISRGHLYTKRELENQNYFSNYSGRSVTLEFGGIKYFYKMGALGGGNVGNKGVYSFFTKLHQDLTSRWPASGGSTNIYLDNDELIYGRFRGWQPTQGLTTENAESSIISHIPTKVTPDLVPSKYARVGIYQPTFNDIRAFPAYQAKLFTYVEALDQADAASKYAGDKTEYALFDGTYYKLEFSQGVLQDHSAGALYTLPAAPNNGVAFVSSGYFNSADHSYAEKTPVSQQLSLDPSGSYAKDGDILHIARLYKRNKYDLTVKATSTTPTSSYWTSIEVKYGQTLVDVVPRSLVGNEIAEEGRLVGKNYYLDNTWYSDSTGTGVLKDQTMPAGPAIVYYKILVSTDSTKYTLSFYAAPNVPVGTPAEYTAAESTVDPGIYALEQETQYGKFKGWVYYDGAAEKKFTFGSTITRSYDLYAKWEPIVSTYKVFYLNERGGSAADIISYPAGATIDNPGIYTQGQEVDPYGRFLKWIYYPFGTNYDSAEFPFGNITATKDLNVYAVWSKVYDLDVYHADSKAKKLIDNMFLPGGSNGTTVQVDSSMTDWDVPVMNSSFYTVNGYSFVKPNYESGAKDAVAFTGSAKINFSVPRDYLPTNKSKTNLYIHYERNGVSAAIFYDHEIEASRQETPEVLAFPTTAGASFTLPAENTFIRSGYKLAGWKVLTGGYSGVTNGTVHAPGASIPSPGENNDVEFAAVWEKLHTVELVHLDIQGNPLTVTPPAGGSATTVPNETISNVHGDGWKMPAINIPNSAAQPVYYKFLNDPVAPQFAMDTVINFETAPPAEIDTNKKLVIYVYHVSKVITVSVPTKIQYYANSTTNSLVQSPTYSFKNLSEQPVNASFTRLVTEAGKSYLDGKGFTIEDNGITIVPNATTSSANKPLEMTLNGVAGSAFEGHSLPGAGSANPGLTPNETLDSPLGTMAGTKYSGTATTDVGQFNLGGKYHGNYSTAAVNMKVAFVFHFSLAPFTP